MGKSETGGEKYDGILLRIPFMRYAVITVSLPLFSLIYCFFSAVIFKPELVNETMCSVRNFIPSISAVTGVSPQCYIWRICIALHSTPRLLVAVMRFNNYKNRISVIAEQHQSLYLKLVHLNFCLNTIENCCLVGVTYISNKENYPLHEKIFIVFMVTTLCYMLLNTILFRWSKPGPLTEVEERSYWWKKTLFSLIIISTAGLLIFFYQHRVLCAPMAFSWFSLCEYGIAITNMGYHMTGALDFQEKTFIAGCCHSDQAANGSAVTNHRKKRE